MTPKRVNRIYVYYEEMHLPEQRALLPLWLQQWRAHGWQPQVVGPSSARRDPRYPAMLAKSRSVPCAHPGAFQTANFTRWLAFAALPGTDPIAIADYDVFPIAPFPPCAPPADLRPLCADGSGGPGFIVGTPADFSRIADAILAYEPRPEETHVSDMTILHTMRSTFTITHQIECYGRNGWRSRPLCHFGNSYMDPKRPKLDQVREALIALNALRA